MSSVPDLAKSSYAGIKREGKHFDVSIITPEKTLSYKVEKSDNLVKWFKKIAQKKKLKIIAAGLEEGSVSLKKLGSRLWLIDDIIPVYVNSLEDKTSEVLARVACNQFFNDVAKIVLGHDNRVKVSDLVTLDDYKKVTDKKEFSLLSKLSGKINDNRIVFFSATPRGGGVALMRHALMRLYKLLGVNASWHVMLESPEVFEITKRKFHNVLHGIAAPEVVLSESDKKLYMKWIKSNAEKLHSLFHDAKVIVIDDPQPSGLVPYIRKASPKTKIIYRSHTQLETSLFERPKNPQSITWNFVWENIKSADLFVSHPVKKFVPKMVDEDKTVLMTASFDPLDGLNKPLNKDQMEYYLDLFDKYLIDGKQKPLDRKRPIIVQVARFDPSKGIPDVVDSFKKLRDKLADGDEKPQLVITGQGSVDDPEGVPLLKATLDLISNKRYQKIRDDIKVARTPGIDQIQNTIMRKSKIYLQLSHKEGFEDKISAALAMGVPAIIYDIGGMPLQVIDGKSGYIVQVGETEKVADYMHKLLSDDKLHKRMSSGAKDNVIDDATTVSNAINWLYMANELIDKGRIKGNMKKVFDLARK
jgi:glycosyltransferase involved in cell wall biosynthesis